MLQVMPQMKILVAIEPVDFRRVGRPAAGKPDDLISTGLLHDRGWPGSPEPISTVASVLRKRSAKSDLCMSPSRMSRTLELIEVDGKQLDDVLRRDDQPLDEQESLLIRRVFESYAYVSDLVQDKNTSIRRLRELFLGSRTDKSDAVTGQKTRKHRAEPPAQTGADRGKQASDASTESEATATAKGHGRNGSEAYRGGSWIDVSHPSLTVDDARPACDEGAGYDKPPGVLVRINGQPLSAKIYQLEKLRCHSCGQVFTETAPDAAGEQKYDASAGNMIGLLKYGNGLTFHGLQAELGVPLPALTQ